MTKGVKTPLPDESLATESSKGVNQRERFPARLDRYAKAKKQALTIADYITEAHPSEKKLIRQVSECGQCLIFRDYYTVNEIRLMGMNSCRKHLLCPLCALRRGARALGRFVPMFDQIMAENGLQKPYLITYTIKDGPDLSERYHHLTKSLRRYHKRRNRKNAACELADCLGAVWSVEVKKGANSGLWHPHAHQIALFDREPSQAAISEQWHSITGDSFVVDVRPIDMEDPISGFLEVFKYALKFSDQTPEDTYHCYETLRGKRLVGSFGEFFGFKEPEQLTDDPLEDLPYVEVFYKYLNGKYNAAISPL